MEGRGVAGGDRGARVLFWAFLRIEAGGEDGVGPARDSKAEIRDWSVVEGMGDVVCARTRAWTRCGGHGWRRQRQSLMAAYGFAARL